MSSVRHLFASYQPLDTPLHRAPLGLKVTAFLVLGLLLTLGRNWVWSLLGLGLVVAFSALAKISLRSQVLALLAAAPLALLLLAYHLYAASLGLGASLILTLLTLILASKLLLHTTPVPHLIEGLMKLLSPVSRWGLPVERLGLALGLLIRTLPQLADQWTLLEQAAAARGVKVPTHRLLFCLLVEALASAQRTGEALAARNLPDQRP